MANNRFSKELEDLLKEERKAISLDDLMQDTTIVEDTTPADQLEDTTIAEDTTPADQLEDTIPEDTTIAEDTTPPADQLEDNLSKDIAPPVDQPKDEFTTDPLAYIREKYNISSKTPDTSYQDLKDLQRRSSIQRSIGNLDKALGNLGSWKYLEAKRRGYDVPGYTGGAFERSAEEAEKQFKERQAFQEKERQKKEQEFAKTKSAFDFEKTLREFDQSTKSQQEMNDPNSQASKSMREVIAGLYGENAVPQNISGNQMLRLFPDLKQLTKAKLESDLRKQEEREKFGFEKELKGMELAKGEKNKFEETLLTEQAKDYQQFQSSAFKADQQLQNINDALKEFEKYTKAPGTIGGTGDIATLFGMKKIASSDLENLDNKFKKISMDALVTNFSGMSRAMDSNAEREAFNATQPDIQKDDPVNASALLGAKSMVLKTKAEAAAQKKHLQNNPNLTNYVSPIIQKVITVINKNGKMILIPKEDVEEYKKDGYYDLDTYADIILGKGK